MKKFLVISTFFVFLAGCFSTDEIKEIKNKTLGERKISYYSNKTFSSLEVPPDLTSPEYQNSFRISEFVKDIEHDFVDLSNNSSKSTKVNLREKIADIKVKKSGNRRWLEINKSPEIIWNLTQDFFKQKGFAINYMNPKTGIIETDFLEQNNEAPDQSVGLIRSLIRKGTGQSYSLPFVDKYRARIEPINNGNKSELFLSLYSMEEVIKPTLLKEANTIWVEKNKDIELETEMLYELMVFLGNDRSKAKEKIIQAQEESKYQVEVKDAINGYAKLKFNSNFVDTWDNFAWALDQLNISIQDSDIKEKSFYIKTSRTADQGIFTTIFGDEAVSNTYQISLKGIDENSTEIYFNDISEENEIDTKQFSYDFFNKIRNQFK